MEANDAAGLDRKRQQFSMERVLGELQEHVRLSAVAGINARVYRPYLLKEEQRALYRSGPRSASEHLRSWLSWASRSNLAPFVKLGRTLRQ